MPIVEDTEHDSAFIFEFKLTTVPGLKEIHKLSPKTKIEIVDMSDEEILAVDSAQTTLARYQRNQKLQETDWTLLPDSPLTESQKQNFVLYRQQLRDIPLQSGFPWDIIWPVSP